jgi:hypothetical protein
LPGRAARPCRWRPGFGGQVIGDDGDPVAFAHGDGGVLGEQPEGGDLDPAGDAIPAWDAGGKVERQPQLDTGSAIAGGELAGSSPRRPVTVTVIGFMEFLPGAVDREGWPPW